MADASRRFPSLLFAIANGLLALFARLHPGNLLPRQPLILFGAMNGRFYGDNSRHLFEWMLEHRPQYRCVWVTNDKAVVRLLTEQQRPVVHARSLQAINLLMRASAGVFTNSLLDLTFLPPLIPSRLRLIALRHGRSVKRVRYARRKHKISLLESLLRAMETRLLYRVISTSDFISQVQEECLQVGAEKHVVTGYPRNDHLFNPPVTDRADWIGAFGSGDNIRTILYGPSWRHGREPTRFFPFDDFDAAQLERFLASHRLRLLLRPHKNDLLKYPETRSFLEGLAADCEHVALATHFRFPDVNTILPFVDILISDYSALFHDFLLLDRPLIFIPYDYDTFEELNGFLYDYHKYLPGPAVTDFQSFLTALTDAAEGGQAFQPRRDILKGMVHQHQDDRSRERVADLLAQLMPEPREAT